MSPPVNLPFTPLQGVPETGWFSKKNPQAHDLRVDILRICFYPPGLSLVRKWVSLQIQLTVFIDIKGCMVGNLHYKGRNVKYLNISGPCIRL